MFGRHATIPIDINLQKASPEERARDFFNCKEPDLEQLTGSRMKQLEESKQNILKAQNKQKEMYDKKHANPMHYKVGQLVLKKDFTRKKRKGGKLEARFLGPYTIHSVLPHGTYRLADPAITENQGVTIQATGSHLKPYNKPGPTD